MSFFADLSWRGLVYQATEDVERLIDGTPIRLYAGFDPTADSLHVGSLLPLTMLARFQRAGHRPVAVVGGGTGMIGDPSGKSAERNLLGEAQIEANLVGLREQIGRFLDFAPGGALLLDNGDWLKRLSLIEFLRDVGKSFTVNYMLAKDSVKRRLGSDVGISYTEFTYLVLQAYDFQRLFEDHGVVLQVGGSDQWGNITAGIDLIRSQRAARAHGFVFPLVTKADGSKFGKTESGTVWLSATRTSPYRFYQFWINAADADVSRYLRYFTFLSRAEIEALEEQHAQAPHQRIAHTRLAEEITRMVHGDDGLARAQRATQVFFGGELRDLPAAEVLDVFADVPAAELPIERVRGASFVDLLVEVGLMASKGEARRAIEGGGVYLNNQRVADAARVLGDADLIDGRLIVLRKGKKHHHVVRIGGG